MCLRKTTFRFVALLLYRPTLFIHTYTIHMGFSSGSDGKGKKKKKERIASNAEDSDLIPG